MGSENETQQKPNQTQARHAPVTRASRVKTRHRGRRVTHLSRVTTRLPKYQPPKVPQGSAHELRPHPWRKLEAPLSVLLEGEPGRKESRTRQAGATDRGACRVVTVTTSRPDAPRQTPPSAQSPASCRSITPQLSSDDGEPTAKRNSASVRACPWVRLKRDGCCWPITNEWRLCLKGTYQAWGILGE